MKLHFGECVVERPGQFINIALDGFYLRRPFSASDWDDETLTIIYKVAGKGTRKMAELREGERLDTLAGLGNGYDLTPARGRRILLVGGGAGVPPLIGLAKCLLALKESVEVVLGFNDSHTVICEDAFRSLGLKTRTATLDGSCGVMGTAVDLMQDTDYDYYFACGAMQMLEAVHAYGKEGQLSFEARMACGFGACMGCSCRTLSGYKRICADGPVFLSSEVSFSDQQA